MFKKYHYEHMHPCVMGNVFTAMTVTTQEVYKTVVTHGAICGMMADVTTEVILPGNIGRCTYMGKTDTPYGCI